MAASFVAVAALSFTGVTRMVPHSSVRSIPKMSDTNSLATPDPNFANEELARTWERTGKGKERWKPGSTTGDSVLDSRLLYSSWVLSPLQLHVGTDDASITAALALGWLKLPFRTLPCSEGTLPRLEGKGVPGGALDTPLVICSFAAGLAREGRLAPASGREDIATWLAQDQHSAADFAPLIRGQLADGSPCLNEWGLSVDDALALPALKRAALADNTEEEIIVGYVDMLFKRAGMDGLVR